MKMISIYKLIYSLSFLLLIANCKDKPDGPMNGGGGIEEPKPLVWTGTYEVSDETIVNPERGFMWTFRRFSGSPAISDKEITDALKETNVSLVLIVQYLNNFKDKAISSSEIAVFEANLETMRKHGLKAILRYAYTDTQTGPNANDAPLEIVLQHIGQLKPTFEKYKDVIAFIQTGFIGPWGEWHGSTNNLGTPENQKTIVDALLAAVPQGIMIQLRTPRVKQLYVGSSDPINANNAYTSEKKARIGHHNDCFLTGGTEYGTYTEALMEKEKEYISDEADFVPVGGETCPPTPGYDAGCYNARSALRSLKWTYVNLDYFPETLELWKNSGCFGDFNRDLGYRLALHSSTIKNEIGVGASLPVKLKLINLGFAPVYNKKDMSLVLKNTTTGVFYETPIDADIRIVKPIPTSATSMEPSAVELNKSVSLAKIPAGSYQLYLKIADQASTLKSNAAYSIHLSNKNMWSTENGGINKLNHQLTITTN